MADFSMVASGGFRLCGCAGPNTSSVVIETRFAVRDFAWIAKKAKRGIQERVSIKKINRTGYLTYNYQDTFNTIWLEKELCTLEESQAFLAQYAIARTAGYAIVLKNCPAVIN